MDANLPALLNVNATVAVNMAYVLEDVTIEDHTEYTVAQIPIALGRDLDKSRLVIGTIKSAGDQDPLVWAFAQKLNGYGQDFSDPSIGPMIDQLASAGGWPDDVRDDVKAIGIRTVPRWQANSVLTEPQEAEVSNYLQSQKLIRVCNDMQGRWNNGEFANLAATKEAFASMVDIASAELGV